MGMSASQARLVALTARMSDVEYEGQQINQQRLTVANQMTAIYSALADMEVPTPPSKLDFKQKIYSGGTDGKLYRVRVGQNGQPYATRVEKNAKSVTANGTLPVGSTVSKKLSIVEPKADKEDFAILSGTTHTIVDVKQYMVQDGFENDASTTKGDNDKKVVCNYTNGDVFISIDEYNGYEDAVKAGWDEVYATPIYRQMRPSDIGSKQPLNASHESVDFAKDAIDISTVQTELDALGNGPFYTITGSEYKVFVPTVGMQFDNIAVEDADGKSYNGEGGKTSVGGQQVMSFTEAEAIYGKEFTDSAAFQGLKNRFPNPCIEGYNSLLWDKDFDVISTLNSDNKREFQFVEKSDAHNDKDGQTLVYSFCTDDIEIPVSELADIKYSTGGSIESATIEGQKVTLGAESVFNEDEYDLAMQKYNNQKAEYDDEQNRLNKQTSIYQRQDKQLELKLTRLDNERNALNTEIDAVKKVIQDSSEKGFKTFSG